MLFDSTIIQLSIILVIIVLISTFQTLKIIITILRGVLRPFRLFFALRKVNFIYQYFLINYDLIMTFKYPIFFFKFFF